MCGSFIHGRSWIDETAWKHFCEPMTINSHNEMPMPASRDVMEIPSSAAKMINDSYRHKEAVRDFPFLRFSVCNDLNQPHTFYPIGGYPMDGSPVDDATLKPTIDEYVIDLREVRGIEVRHRPASPVGREFLLIRDKKPTVLVDWGIQPWDGKYRVQRGGDLPMPDNNFLDPCQLTSDFLPKTRADLMKWSRAHWGKRGDGEEFLAKMPRCLDPTPLMPFVPSDLKQITFQKSSQEKKGAEIIWSNYEASDHYKIVQIIERASNPCDRFCEMFAEAPNAFWAERN